MNERMKELAKQLGYNVNYKPSDDETDREYQVVSNDFAEKFAELIVKECMDIARNVGNISEPDDLAPDRCYEIEQRIQDRFGVEE